MAIEKHLLQGKAEWEPLINPKPEISESPQSGHILDDAGLVPWPSTQSSKDEEAIDFMPLLLRL